MAKVTKRVVENGGPISPRTVQGLSAGAVILMLTNLISTFYFSSQGEIGRKLDELQKEVRQSQATQGQALQQANRDQTEAREQLRDKMEEAQRDQQATQARILADIAEIRARLEALPAMIYEQVHRNGPAKGRGGE
jgi:hypothetical protein